jgi:hypothetical protein
MSKASELVAVESSVPKPVSRLASARPDLVRRRHLRLGPAVVGTEEMAHVPVDSAARSGGGVAPAPITARASHLARLRHRHRQRRRLLRLAPVVVGAQEMEPVRMDSVARNGGGVAPAPTTVDDDRKLTSTVLV